MNVSGKQHRAYSLRRPELQSVVRAAHTKLTTRVGQTSSSKAGKSTTAESIAVDALSLGQLLVSTFGKTPVKAVVWSDEEDATLHRVAECMATRFSDVVMPVQEYVKQVMPMPLIMHKVPRDALQELAGVCSSGSMESWLKWSPKAQAQRRQSGLHAACW